jgi:hypothetical protein
MAMHILKNNIKLSSEFLSDVPVIQELPTSAEDYVNLPFFKD